MLPPLWFDSFLINCSFYHFHFVILPPFSLWETTPICYSIAILILICLDWCCFSLSSCLPSVIVLPHCPSELPRLSAPALLSQGNPQTRGGEHHKKITFESYHFRFTTTLWRFNSPRNDAILYQGAPGISSNQMCAWIWPYFLFL